MQILNLFSNSIDFVEDITEFFNNIKLMFQNSIDFFPQEIISLLIPTLLIVSGLFIYRFVR